MENNNKLSKDFIHWYKTGIINDPRPITRYGENDVARKEEKRKSCNNGMRRLREKGGGRRNACLIEGCSTGARKDGFCRKHSTIICSFEGCTTPAQDSCGGMCSKHRKNKPVDRRFNINKN